MLIKLNYRGIRNKVVNGGISVRAIFLCGFLSELGGESEFTHDIINKCVVVFPISPSDFDCNRKSHVRVDVVMAVVFLELGLGLFNDGL